MGKFLGILAVLLVVYFVITRPVAAADAAEDIGGALATAAGSLVTFTDALVGGSGTDDDTGSTGSSEPDPESDAQADPDGEGSGSAGSTPAPVPTSVPGGVAGR